LLKFVTEFDNVTTDALQVLRSEGQRSRSHGKFKPIAKISVPERKPVSLNPREGTELLNVGWCGGAENAGVENAAPDGRGGARERKIWKAKSPRYLTLLQVCYNSQ